MVIMNVKHSHYVIFHGLQSEDFTNSTIYTFTYTCIFTGPLNMI